MKKASQLRRREALLKLFSAKGKNVNIAFHQRDALLPKAPDYLPPVRNCMARFCFAGMKPWMSVSGKMLDQAYQ